VIGGYTEPKGSRTGLGALLLGVHDEHCGKLRYAGNVGTGFNEEMLRDLKQRLSKLQVQASPFADVPSSVKAHWVRPSMVAEVSFSERTRDGRIRHPVFQGLRTDKPAAGVTREVAAVVQPGAPRSDAAPAPASKLRVTHPERVIDPSTSLTKGDLVRFYASVSTLMLPHLRERPVALLRAPRGVKAPTFFQKHANSDSELPCVERLDPALDPDHEPLLGLSSAEALASIAQMNVIEVHTWNATTRAIDRPDRIVFDLDPGEGVAWAQVQEAAHLLHAFLDELKLASFLKSSGGKGLHVVVPLSPKYDWDTVKALAQAIVVHLAEVIPERFVAKSGAKNRVGRIYIDYLRNAFGATTIAAWSARARPGLGVSVPITWAELEALRSGAHWNVGNIGERFEQGNAPWDAYEASRQTLTHAMKQLGVKAPSHA